MAAVFPSWFKGRGVRIGFAIAALAALLLLGRAIWERQRQRLWLDEAERAERSLDLDAAYKLRLRLIQARPDDPLLHFRAARTARRGDAFGQAAAHLDQCEQLDGNAGAIELERMLLAVQRGHVASFERRLRERIDAGDPDAGLMLEAMTYGWIQAFHLGKAFHTVEQLVAHAPDNAQAWMCRGQICFELNSLAGALESFEKAHALAPDHELIRRQLAEALLLGRRAEEAERHFQWLHDRRAGDAATLLGLARCRRLLGDFVGAARWLERLPVDLAPTQAAQTALLHGQMALVEGRLEEAEQALRQVVRLTPYDGVALFALGDCLERLGQSEAAQEARSQAKTLDAATKRLVAICSDLHTRPRDVAVRFEAAELCRRTGRNAECRRWLESILALDADHAGARKLFEELQSHAPPRP